LALIQPLLDQLDIAGIIDRHLPPDPQLEYSQRPARCEGVEFERLPRLRSETACGLRNRHTRRVTPS
jgi:hypothetical protein